MTGPQRLRCERDRTFTQPETRPWSRPLCRASRGQGGTSLLR
jgi:hypothetical protein